MWVGDGMFDIDGLSGTAAGIENGMWEIRFFDPWRFLNNLFQ